MRRVLLLSTYTLTWLVSSAQLPSDTTRINPITIDAYFGSQPLVGLTSSANVVSERDVSSQQTGSLLPALNSIPGLRLEERSPGSYRLALRGSMIRSPFGIRNTKIYVDEFPLTDAGGNSYLNIIDPQSIASIDILKGPDGSLFGANSAGVLRIHPKGFGRLENQATLTLNGGSYGLFNEQLSIQRKVNDSYQFSVDQSFMRSDGYRQNT
ncbi:MAG: TonB-dependent receptor plug domain-containing protein, partial [Sphingobacterium sp.]